MKKEDTEKTISIIRWLEKNTSFVCKSTPTEVTNMYMNDTKNHVTVSRMLEVINATGLRQPPNQDISINRHIEDLLNRIRELEK
jgi:mannosyltransferase OCH1-like enzyme